MGAKKRFPRILPFPVNLCNFMSLAGDILGITLGISRDNPAAGGIECRRSRGPIYPQAVERAFGDDGDKRPGRKKGKEVGTKIAIHGGKSAVFPCNFLQSMRQ